MNIHNRKAFPLFFYLSAKTASRLLWSKSATKSLFEFSKTDRCNAVGVRNDNMTLRFCGFVVFHKTLFLDLFLYVLLFYGNVLCFSGRIVLIREWLFWFGKNCSGSEGVVLNCRADPRKTRISVWKKSGAERGLSPRAGEAQWKQVASAISFRAAEGYWKDETKSDSFIWLHRP